MNEQDIKTFKDKLEAERTKLEAELSTIGRINPDNPNDWEAVPQDTNRSTDMNDLADTMEEYENNTAILKELETQLVNVKSALEKIEQGNYGKCEIGGEEIEKERLEANPSAKTCMKHINE